MELTSLTVLVDILDAGNLSQAARNLKMTRANVSYHLNQLEKSVGVQLVRRTTRRVEPTEVGLRLYAHGRAIQNEMLAARETITTLGQGLQGRVGLSVPSGYGQMVMSDWLIDFKHLYPGIVLDVRFENRVDDLIRDEVDIAILDGHLDAATAGAHVAGGEFGPVAGAVFETDRLVGSGRQRRSGHGGRRNSVCRAPSSRRRSAVLAIIRTRHIQTIALISLLDSEILNI